MNREFLKKQGLEQEQVDTIMAEYGKSVKGYQDDIAKVERERDDFKEKAEQNNQSEEVETLKAKVEKLEEKNVSLDSSLKEYKAQVVQNELDKEIIKRVSKDAHDPDDIFKFIDKDKFEYDEEEKSYTNIDAVIDELKEDKPYLFNRVDDNSDDDEDDDKGALPKKGYKSSDQRGNNKPKVDHTEKGKALAEQLFGKN